MQTAIFSTTDASPNQTESNQGKYGNDLELPDTYVRCGRCATSFAITADDLGSGKGRYVENQMTCASKGTFLFQKLINFFAHHPNSRVECSVCSHSWFQSRDRLFTLNEGRELVPMPQSSLDRIASNLAAGRDPDYIGDTKFFVGNLDFAVQEDDIRELFAEVGEVGDVSLVIGPDGRSRGFAFVTMMEEKVTDSCLALDGKDLFGRSINVKLPN